MKKQHIVSFSGGKDSTALLIQMLERKMQVDRIVFADTLYEFPDLYEYINTVNDYIKKYGDYEIEILKPTRRIEDEVFEKITRGPRKGEIRGFPLVAFGCYWSRDVKQKPLNEVCKGNIRYIGIALDEKERRIKDWEEQGFRYPLIDWGWTEADCLQYLKDINLQNPLYDKFDRLGCYWCPKQSIKSLKVLYREYPVLWKKVLDLDRKIKSVHPDRQFKPGRDLWELDRRFKKEVWLEKNQLSIFKER